MASYVLAVDLGTTNVAAALLRDGDAHPVLIELGSRIATMPSTVFLQADGTLVVGEAAERRAVSDPERVARGFKRRLGDPVPMILGGTPVGPAGLLATLARDVLELVSRREGGPPRRVALTHPANWGPWKLEQLRQVADLSGIADPVFVSEPEAAALNFAHRDRVEPGEAIAVYDLGGGTFDATVLQRTDEGYRMLGEPTGIEQLGGMDFDEALLAHVLRIEGHDLNRLDATDPTVQRALQELRQSCALAKETLSVETDAVVDVDLGAGRRADVRVTRREFEGLIRPAVVATVGALEHAIAVSGVDPMVIGRVLLAGGSSRVPLIGELVGAALHRRVAVDSHPKHTVALGAALLAGDRVAAGGAAPTDPTSLTPPVVGSAAAAGPPRSSAPPPQAGPPPVPGPPLAGPRPGPPLTGPPPPTGPPLLPGRAPVGAAPPAHGVRPDPRHAFPPPTGVPVASSNRRDPALFVPTPSPGPSHGRRWPMIAALVGVLGLLTGAGAVLVARGSDAGATEVFAEPANDIGPAPFTPNTASTASTASPPTSTIAPTTSPPPPTTPPTTAAASGAITTKVGDAVGLYGGSLDVTVCDKPKLVRFLTSDQAKGRAWAQAQGIAPDQIAPFVATLTPVLLRDDVRVTNNGFDESTGRPTPRQSILERGTAVLVDRLGIPRVRCFCGNPLGPPQAVRQKLVGRPWPGLDTAKVTRIVPAPAEVNSFAVFDVSSGALVTLPADGAGQLDPTTTTAAPPATATTVAVTTTSAPTTTVPVPTTTAPITTTTAADPIDLTAFGAVSASSTFGGGMYPPTLAVDGSFGTSWFSAGPQNGRSSYALALSSSRTIRQIGLVSNADNSDPQVRRNFGFGHVTVEVRNAGAVTFSEGVDLSGTPDPDVELSMNVVGDEITLVFTGSEDPTCGGFAELIVLGL